MEGIGDDCGPCMGRNFNKRTPFLFLSFYLIYVYLLLIVLIFLLVMYFFSV